MLYQPTSGHEELFDCEKQKRGYASVGGPGISDSGPSETEGATENESEHDRTTTTV